MEELQALQGQAVQGVGDTASAILDLRNATVSQLTALAAQQDKLAAVQQDLLQKQLTQLTRISSGGTSERVPHGVIHTGERPPISAQGGFHSDLLGADLLIQAHRGERVDIGQSGQTNENQPTVILDFRGLTINVPEGKNAREAGYEVARVVMDVLEKNKSRVGRMLFDSGAGVDFERKMKRGSR